ncbi:MAG: globin [Sulfurimonadaceae bacterium]|nr:globin [Sulfurimonadaceae bacterium]
MELKITEGQLGERPPVTKPNPSFLPQIGEERFRKLVSDHYDLIKESEIAFLFPVHDDEEFSAAKRHAADFMIQICGGPDYFNQSRGAPRMVGRHAPFRIDASSRRVWLGFYAQLLPALVEEGISEADVQSFWNYLDIFSIWMVNTPS